MQPLLSARGKVTVLTVTGQTGWTFGTDSGGATGGAGGGGTEKRTRETEGSTRSKTLIVSDLPDYLEAVRLMLEKIDAMPRQVLIEAKIMEVNDDILKDIGFDWGTGQDGALSSGLDFEGIAGNDTSSQGEFAAHGMTSAVAPSVFGAKATGLSGIHPFNTGLELAFRKLTSLQLQMVLHALAEDVNTNTLSAPSIVVLNNQEATILVGTKYPILEANVSGSDTTTITSTLDYYQDIGIQLNVIPQISDNEFIDMIIHPAVSSYTTTAKAKASGGVIVAEYPIIDIREAETQVLMKDNETVVIGGLIKDVQSDNLYSVPILGDIPLLGNLFKRTTKDTMKIDLLIFITARIITPDVHSEVTTQTLPRVPTSQRKYVAGEPRQTLAPQ